MHLSADTANAAGIEPRPRVAGSVSGSRARVTAVGDVSLSTDRSKPLTTSREMAAYVASPSEFAWMDAAASDTEERISRVLNMVISGIALMILAPVCVLVAIAVRLTSPGPVFYTQTRVGIDRRSGRASPLHERRVEDLGGQPFTILKFRSMSVNAEANGQAVWATKHDARVTPVGRVLRKTRLDEIPQLINVLRGEMNIVGPRPERPSIVVRLRTDIPEYPHRHRVKPGITGWAQINHPYDSCIEDVRKKVRYDLEYIGRRSVWFDLKIMLLTLPVMLFRKGAH